MSNRHASVKSLSSGQAHASGIGPSTASALRPHAIEALRTLNLLRNLPDHILTQILLEAEIIPVQASDIITLEGARRQLYFAWRGAFRVTIMSPSGIHITIRRIPSGGHFGELSLLTGQDLHLQAHHAIADTDGALLALSERVMRHLIETSSAFSLAMLQATADLAIVRGERLYEFAVLSARLRLEAELLRLARDGARQGDRIVIRPAPTHDALASQIGLTRESVTRHLKAMAQQGMVQHRRGEIVVPDIKRLAQSIERKSGRVRREAE